MNNFLNNNFLKLMNKFSLPVTFWCFLFIPLILSPIFLIILIYTIGIAKINNIYCFYIIYSFIFIYIFYLLCINLCCFSKSLTLKESKFKKIISYLFNVFSMVLILTLIILSYYYYTILVKI